MTTDKPSTARAIASCTLSLGLVAVAVRVFSTVETSHELSLHLLHAKCGSRLKQQLVCPIHNEAIAAVDMARGYEVTKGQHVELTADEVRALQAVADPTIELVEFVPVTAIDPVFCSATYYLGPDKGAERGYKLIAEAMSKTNLVGIAKYTTRGKQHVVMVRPNADGLVMTQLRYADEVKRFADVPVPELRPCAAGELKLAIQLVKQLRRETFSPEQYEDEVKARMLELIEQKVAGKEIAIAPAQAKQGQVIDLLVALKRSLEIKKPIRRKVDKKVRLRCL